MKSCCLIYLFLGRLHKSTSKCNFAPVRECLFAIIWELTFLRISGLFSARLILNLREWSDRTLVRVSVSLRAGQSEGRRQRSTILLTLHAATVGHITSSDEFGSDPLDYVHDDLDCDYSSTGP
jgi:hypothetical protein